MTTYLHWLNSLDFDHIIGSVLVAVTLVSVPLMLTALVLVIVFAHQAMWDKTQ